MLTDPRTATCMLNNIYLDACNFGIRDFTAGEHRVPLMFAEEEPLRHGWEHGQELAEVGVLLGADGNGAG